MLKRLLASSVFVIAAATLCAQTAAPKAPPKSPTETASVTIAGKTVSITYSSPRVNGREGKIFTKDGLIGHDKTYPVWRAGANAATKFHTDGDLMIENLVVPKGDYTLYVDVSNPDSWQLVINKQTGQWGTVYDKAQDLGRVPFPTNASPSLVENLTYTLKDLGGNRASLNLSWEDKSATVAFSVK